MNISKIVVDFVITVTETIGICIKGCEKFTVGLTSESVKTSAASFGSVRCTSDGLRPLQEAVFPSAMNV